MIVSAPLILDDNLYIGRAALGSTGDLSALVLSSGGEVKQRILGSMAFVATTDYEHSLSVPASDGYVLSSTTLGVRSWVPLAGSSGTVTSVAMTVPIGLSVSGAPITNSGTLAVTLSAGYSIPTTASQGNWNISFGWGNHATNGYITGITQAMVNAALGYTAYSSTNPAGYITGITSGNVTTALGFTPYNSTNPSGFITGITSSMVTTALGYTPVSGTPWTGMGYLTGTPWTGYGYITSVPWSIISSKPTTLGGYAITDWLYGNYGGLDGVPGQSGCYYFAGNSPIPDQSDGTVWYHAYPAAPTTWGSQLVQDYRTGRAYYRGRNSGTWSGWLTGIDSGNIGSQSVNYANSAGSAPASGGTSTTATNVYHYASRTDGTWYNIGWFSGNPSPAYSCDAVQIRSSDGTIAATHYEGSGNVGGTGRASHHPSGIYSQGTNWLYGSIIMAGNSISGVTTISASGAISASNFSGSSSGTNTGDQSIPTSLPANGGTSDNARYLYDEYRGSYRGSSDLYVAYAYSSGTASRATRANGNFYIDDNYGNSVVGVYSASRYQGVYAMGDAYKLAADGSTTGSLYGIAWSHPNAGGAASYLASHGMLLMQNGSLMAAISTNAWFSGAIAASNFSGSHSGSSSGTNTGDQYIPTSLPANGGTSSYSTYLWSTSHGGSYYISNAWTGTYWQITSNHGAGVQVAYSDSTGSVTWGNVSGRPGSLSQFSNDLGNYGEWAASGHSHTGYMDISANRLYDNYTGGAMYAYNGRIYNGWLGNSVNVYYADQAGNADTVDGWHRDDLRAYGNLTGLPSLDFAVHRGEGTNYVDYTRYMYDEYRGGWRGSSDLYVSYAYSSGNADTVDGQHFAWSNRNNNPTYLWAADSNGDGYLAWRGGMSVSYSDSSGSISGYNNPSTGAYANTIAYRDGNGYLTAVQFYGTSTKTAKHDIKVLENFDAIKYNNSIVINTYLWNGSNDFGLGFIAEDTHWWLSGKQKKAHNLNHHVGILTLALQQVDAKIDSRYSKLEKEIEELRKQLKQYQDGRN